MLGCGVPVAGLLLLSFIFITPFSPRWLVTKGRVEEARKVLRSIRGVSGKSVSSEEGDAIDEAVEAELRGIEATVEENRSVSKKEVFAQPWVRWAVVVGVALSFIQQMSGVNAVNAYAPDVLKGEQLRANIADSHAELQPLYCVHPHTLPIYSPTPHSI